MKEIIKQNLRLLRKEAGLGQRNFSSLFKISQSQIGSYEEGRATPSLETLLAIAQHYGVSLEDFITKNLSDVWKENAANAAALRILPSSLGTREVRKAANAIVKNAQALLSAIEQGR